MISENDAEGNLNDTVRLFAVVVLYKVAPANSITLKTLLKAKSLADRSALRLHIHVHDNTPTRLHQVEVPEGVSYYSSGQNEGLAKPYNIACDEAGKLGFDWLLTLDQDTQLPEDFFLRSVAHLREMRNTPMLAALVPQMVSGDRILSPYRFQFGGATVVWFQKYFQGIPAETVYAFNSGSMLRLSALQQAGGYDQRFWLDQSDTSLFNRLSAFGKRVYIAGDIQVEHNFSMVSGNRRVPPQRYRSILEAEMGMCDLSLGPLAGSACTVRLMIRWIRYRHETDKALRSLTWSMLKLRLFHSRSFRLNHWNQLRVTRGGAVGTDPLARRPKLSVCMATYNGERFVVQQLRSILDQLDAEDEVIVVDDASRDATVAMIKSLHDDRVRIIVHKQNQGVVKTFEQSIRNATGDIIFLSDMDDLWASRKVQKTLDALQHHPEADLIVTSLALIDENDKVLTTKMYLDKRPFTPGLLANFIRNRYQGSTMAFRSTILQAILPFPVGRLFYHDVWIGMQNAARGGRTVFLDEPLLLYRRHSTNVSGTLSRSKQLKLRIQLGSELVLSLLRQRLGSYGLPLERRAKSR